MKRNKTLKSLVGLALSASILASTTAFAQLVSVSSIVEHPALDSIRDGVKQALTDAGYTEEKGLKWQFQTAQGNTAIASQIARKFVGDKSDVIVAISTPSAQAVVAATKSIPVLYSGVTDPVAAQLVPSWDPSKTNVSGVSDMLVLEKQLELIKKVVPDAKTVGMVYNPGEANSVVVVERLRELLSANNMNLVEATAARTVDVGAAARSLVGKADVFYTNTDNNVVSAFEALVKVGNDSKIPIIASDTDSVSRGAIAALGVNYYDLGVQTGKMVVRVLKGEKPGDMASETSDQLELFVNPGAAEKQGVTLDDAFIKSATKIVE
ncbi:ABC transporter substrate-binding protein [Paenalcaligenes hominis]|uniref:ABC transporter substrate-binding protein n=1 Tax=Paenalcaligenes hominis TaxID=643674 RepID=A0A1U9JY55_9BURK|nr:ABC transporter substrate-binding protein [Paenalcaligenes hominis]AQS50659.1 ABC transporter substrate-binding protein [Paenalcaligenes hominis]